MSTTIQEKDITERFLEHRGETKGPPHPTASLQITSNHLKCKRSGYMLTALSSPEAREVLFGKVSLGLLVPPVGKNPVERISLGLCGPLCGTFYSDLTPWGLQENLQGSIIKNL